MATFTAEVYQNEFLPDGGTDVHAIVTVTCAGAGEAGQVRIGDAGEIVIVDTSGSMGERQDPRRQARRGGRARPGARRRLVRGRRRATTRRGWPIPPAAEPGMVRMDDRTRAEAKARDRRLPAPDGGTAMGTWLRLATQVFAAVPGAGPEARDPADRRR